MNFIQADFKHLNKNLGKTPAWHELSQKFCTALQEQYNFKKSDIPKIYIGESHCLSYAHSRIFTKDGPHLIAPKIKSLSFFKLQKTTFKTITRINLNRSKPFFGFYFGR